MSVQSNSGFDSARAWVVVFAGFVGSFITFGISYCFGVFLKPIGLEFRVSHAAMSSLFSVITGISFFAAPFTGKIADRYGPRPVVAIGGLLLGCGMILTAHVHSFALLFLTYGVGLGGAVACTYIPSISAVGEWFKKYRDVALGLTISGIGCGTLVAAPLSAMLIERHGWRSAFEIFGWGGAALLLILRSLALSAHPLSEKKNKQTLPPKFELAPSSSNTSLFSSPELPSMLPSSSFPPMQRDIGASRIAGAGLVGYIGASSVIGRLGLGALAPKFGLMKMYQASYLILLISFGVWLAAGSYSALVVFALLMGVGYGGIAAMSPAVAAATFGVEGLGELLGILFTGFGVACLVGPPVSGILVDHFHDYKWPVFVGAGASILALFFVILLQIYSNKIRPPSKIPSKNPHPLI